MSPERRKFIQDLYIRVCRDSGFKLEWERAAALAGATGGFHPMDVWNAMPDLDTMRKIAAGNHPAAHKEPHP